jgi:hypothetical protein
MWWKRVRYVLALLALCAIATCPAAKRACVAERRAHEADDLLDYLGDRVAETVQLTGKVPPLAAGPTPQTSCCDQGGACNPDPATWATPAWQALRFSIDNSYRYTYSYVPDPDGSSAVLRAAADLDCDGTPSRVELRITVNGSRAVERAWTR